MVREIVFDTETTGLDPASGDKLVEIGAVELINHVPIGKTYHQYINPERDVPDEAFRVHGLSWEYLKGFPIFADVAQEFVDFIGDDGILVAHNAAFDIKFINYELKHLGYATYDWDRVVDTLEIAKKKFPGRKGNSLDALCKRFGIDNSARTLHGALLDAQLLAEVYLELLGGAEPTMEFSGNGIEINNVVNKVVEVKKIFRQPRLFNIDEEDEKNHRAFLEKKIKNPLWLSDEIVAGGE